MGERSHKVGPRWWVGVRLGVWYAAMVFGVGFVCGIARAMAASWLHWGDFELMLAELVEVAVIVALAWRLGRRAASGLWFRERAWMGITVLGVLLVLELVVGMWLRGMGLRAWVEHFGTIRGAIALTGYVLVSVVPIARGG